MRRRRSPNAEGNPNRVSLHFDENAEPETAMWKAKVMSHRLVSMKHGTRHRAIVALLAALYDFSEHVDFTLTADEMSALFLTRMMTGAFQSEHMERVKLAVETSDLVIETDRAGITAEEIAARNLASVRRSGVDDDLWDD